jgi:hypothetical protein
VLIPCSEAEIEAVQQEYQNRVAEELRSRLGVLQTELDTRIRRLEAREREFEAKGGDVLALWELIHRTQVLEPQGLPPSARDFPPPKDLWEALQSMIDGRGFRIRDATLQQLVVASAVSGLSGDILILAGPTGVGKTSLVQQVAWAFGAGYEVVPVRPAWTDPSDLLGFYNPMHRCYQPTTFVQKLVEARSWEELNRLFFLCLDEMNLARIENYAADFLSRLEKSRRERAVLNLYSPAEEASLFAERQQLADLGSQRTMEQAQRLQHLHTLLETFPACFPIPRNLILCGTVNVDETTYLFSPKVLDRSFVVRFPSAEFDDNFDTLGLVNMDRPSEAVWDFPISQLLDITSSSVSKGFTKSMQTIWTEFTEWQIAYLKPLGIQLGYRLPQAYNSFMRIGHRLLRGQPWQLASIFFQAKLLPRISFNKQDNAIGRPGRKIDVFKQWLDDSTLDKYPETLGYNLRQELQYIVERNAGRPVIQYWD